MGKEVKVTASESLTADKGIRIGKTMSKNDEPTMIPIDRDLGGAKKKTVNKTTSKKISVKSSDGVSRREAEKISDAADALAMGSNKPIKKPVRSAAKTPVGATRTGARAGTTRASAARTGAATGAKTLVMDGMTRQKAATTAVAKAQPKTVAKKKSATSAKSDSLKLDASEFIDEEKKDTEVKAKDDTKRTKQPSSKPKAAIVAIATAIVVGVAGMLLVSFLNRQDDKMCILQFESNGGSKIESQEVVCGTKATRPDDPEKEGFEFQDWLLDRMPFNFEEETIDSDLIVTAKWLVKADTEVVTITFDSAGGSEVAEREAVKGRPTTAPLDPTRDGYTFDGWYLDGEKFDFDTPIDESITLVAGWKASDGTVTVPQGNSNSGTTSKPALQWLTLQQGKSMVAGTSADLQINAVPTSAELDVEVRSDNENAVKCTAEGDARVMSCMAAGAGQATITVKDRKTGKTATTTIVVTDDNSGYIPPSGGGNGGGSTTPTTPDCPDGQELVDGVCVNKKPTEPEPTTPDCPDGQELVDGVCVKAVDGD